MLCFADDYLVFTIHEKTCEPENRGVVRLHVHRSQFDRGPLNVTVQYEDVSAKSGSDYLTTIRILEFHEMDEYVILEIPIVDDLVRVSVDVRLRSVIICKLLTFNVSLEENMTLK